MSNWNKKSRLHSNGRDEWDREWLLFSDIYIYNSESMLICLRATNAMQWQFTTRAYIQPMAKHWSPPSTHIQANSAKALQKCELLRTLRDVSMKGIEWFVYFTCLKYKIDKNFNWETHSHKHNRQTNFEYTYIAFIKEQYLIWSQASDLFI